MPIHDWTRVRANRFHHFHQTWSTLLAAALNQGLLPEGYLALAEQKTGGPEPDVVTLSVPYGPGGEGGLALADRPVQVRLRDIAEASRYAQKANRITVRHGDGDVVAVIEIVSPGNKDGAHAVKSFARKAVRFIEAGIHLLIVDLFPPRRYDPQGIHQVIWDRIKEHDFKLPADKPLTAVAYSSGDNIQAFVEPLAVGDRLPDMPIFLTPDRYVPCPLETTYQQSWDVFPKLLKGPLEAPLPNT